MKKIIILLFVLFFSSCSYSDENNNQNNNIDKVFEVSNVNLKELSKINGELFNNNDLLKIKINSLDVYINLRNNLKGKNDIISFMNYNNLYYYNLYIKVSKLTYLSKSSNFLDSVLTSNIKRLDLTFFNYDDLYSKYFHNINFDFLEYVKIDFGNVKSNSIENFLIILNNGISLENNTSLFLEGNDYIFSNKELKILSRMKIRKLVLGGVYVDSDDKIKSILNNSETLDNIDILDYGKFYKKDYKIIFEKY